MNKVFLSGRLTKDPVIQNTGRSKAYLFVGLAVDRVSTKADNTVDFFDLVVWDKTAEFFDKYLRKGSKIFVEGRLQSYSYEKDGVKRSGVQVVVDRVEFGESKKNSEGAPPAKTHDDVNASKMFEEPDFDDDNIPF